MKNTCRLLCCLLTLAAGPVLTGCAAKPPPRIEARYYAQCIQPLVRMQEADNRVAQATVRSALGGAFAGAVIGLFTTAANPSALPLGIGIGAAAGAAVGAGVGYSFAVLDRISDENVRFASIRITANQDLSKANRLQLYSYESLICYMREFESLQTAYRQGTLDREAYQARFRELYAAMRELGRIIGKMDAELARTEKEFNALFSRPTAATEAPRAAPPPASEAVRPPRTRPRSRNRLSATLAVQQARVQQAQKHNEADLTVMLQECSGKVSPPRQDAGAIRATYGNGYTEARLDVDTLRATHQELLEIMHDAALQSGIDIV